MNPGGDFGKKELSPALRNRFTEVWVPAVAAKGELLQLLHARLCKEASVVADWDMAEAMLDFVEWFGQPGGGGIGGGSAPSLRDLAAWVDFVNVTVAQLGSPVAFVHGACLVFVDAIGLQVAAASPERRARRARCLTQLQSLLPCGASLSASDLHISTDTAPEFEPGVTPQAERAQSPEAGPHATGRFGLAPFYVPLGDAPPSDAHFSLRAPTTRANAFRMLRAMQLRKPVLLEGSPGVGKTSLVQALGAACGRTVVRINLSDQSDLMELLGADMPVEGAPAGTYAWQDGAFLSALRAGHWVILDELNLAPQSVLEGLNACLDHRASVYIPELGASFDCAPGFRVFGCQNPLQQGGGRKGLPKSFLNRFTQVWMEELGVDDMLLIINAQFGTVSNDILGRMIAFVRALQREIVSLRRFGARGSPWDFNLRDVFRWCELMVAEQQPPHWRPWQFVDSIFLQRMRSEDDRAAVIKLYAATVGDIDASCPPELQPWYSVSRERLQVGTVWLPRVGTLQPESREQPPLLLPLQLRPLQALMMCVRMQWMCVLCGDAGAGKSTLARVLARLTGHRLREAVLSTATDTTELLGCFEQSEPSRLVLSALQTAGSLVAEVTGELLVRGGRDLSLLLESEAPRGGGATEATSRKEACSQAVALAAQVQAAWEPIALLGEGGGSFGVDEWTAEHSAQVGRALELLEATSTVLVGMRSQEVAATAPISGPASTEGLGEQIRWIRSRLAKAQELQEKGIRGRFVWVDGPMVTAMEKGEWLLLDNANLCSPSVLDRLNPLLERGGLLQLPECGLQPDGSVREVHAHPDFRLILCIDPSRGELSRAMRNRGVEVVIMPPRSHCGETLALLGAAWGHEHAPAGDLQPSAALQVAMASTHSELALSDKSTAKRSCTALLRWSDTTAKRLQRGSLLPEALHEAAGIAYASALPVDGIARLEALCQRCAAATEDDCASAAVALSLDSVASEATWPVPRGTSGFIKDSVGATVASQAALIAQLASLLTSGRSNGAHFEGLDNGQLQQTLAAAASEFALRSSDEDASRRVAVLEQLAQLPLATECLGPAAGCLGQAAILSGARLVSSLYNHPLKLSVQAALREVCGGDQALCSLCSAAEWALQRGNPPLFERVRRHAASSVSPDDTIGSKAVPAHTVGDAAASMVAAVTVSELGALEAAEPQLPVVEGAVMWLKYTALLPRLRMLNQIESEAIYESLLLERASSITPPQEMTLLQRSLSQQANASLAMPVDQNTASSDSSVWAALVLPLQPCLEAVHDAVVSWLQLVPTDDESEVVLLSALRGLWFARMALWHHCADRSTGGNCDVGLEHQTFLVLWRALHKRLGRLARPPLNLDPPEALCDLCDRVSHAAHFDPSHFSAILWKKGGHPVAPRTVKQLSLTNALRDMVTPLRVDRETSGPTLLVEQPAHAALWAGAPLRCSIVMAVCTVRALGEHSRQAMEGAIKQVDEIPRVLEVQLAACRECAAAAVAANELPNEVRVGVSVWPLADLHSSIMEGALVGSIAAQAWALRTNCEGMPLSIGIIMEQAETFIKLVTNSSARSPLDAAPAQTLVWRMQAAQLAGRLDADWLAGVLFQLSVGWHQQLWGGSVAHTEDGDAALSRGPLRLLLCSETPLICSHLAQALATPLSRRTAALSSILKLCEMMSSCHQRSLVDAASDWRRALHGLCASLFAFRGHLAQAEGAQLSSALCSLFARCNVVLAAASSSRGSHACNEAAAMGIACSGVESLKSAVNTIKQVLPGTTDETLRQSLVPLVWPCLHQLCDAVERIAQSSQADSHCPPCHTARGKMWVLLGLLRWRLLLPEHPVDPTCKHGVKAGMLSVRLQQQRVQLRARTLAQQVWNGATQSAELASRATEVEALRTAQELAAERMCARPAPPGPTFSQLHAELWQWDRSLGDQSSVLHLSAELGRGLPAACAREMSWQQSSDRFLQRLGKTFADFEDFICPVQLAVYEVKHGLRLQAAACVPSAIAAEDGEGAGGDAEVAHAVIRTLLAFPQRPATPSASVTSPGDGVAGRTSAQASDSLPRSLLVLLRPLPVSTAAPSSLSARHTAHMERQWRVTQQSNMGALALQRLYVMVLLTGSTHVHHVHALSRIMGAFAKTQVGVEAAEQRRQEEEASLYKHRARNYGSAGVDNQQEEAASLQKLFPDFAEDFADLVRKAEDDLLDGDDEHGDMEPPPAAVEGTSQSVEGGEGAGEVLRVEPELILKMLTYHERVFSTEQGMLGGKAELDLPTTGKGSRRRGGKDGTPPPTLPTEQAAEQDRWRLTEAKQEAFGALQLSHSTAAQLLPSSATLLPASIDSEAAASHLAMASWTWQHLQGRRGLPAAIGEREQFDLFNEDGASEVARLEPILLSLAARTRGLLEEWNEHAGLQLLLQVCERLRSFRSGSPLMKFIIGAELLLKHCWEWETMACRATSIKIHIDPLTDIVLRWRRMELNAWPRLLEWTALQEHQAALVRVWGRLFRVVNSLLFSHTAEHFEGDQSNGGACDDLSTTDREQPVPTEADEHAHLQEVVGTLEQLMLGAEVGAFEAYLRMLRSFERQMAAEEQLEEGCSPAEIRRKRCYRSILHNVGAYYSQFSAPLQQAVAAQKAPIDAKLKDFVKLSQWSDRNYVALKQSVERSHAQLNRCVNQYQSLLRQTAAGLLASNGANDGSSDEIVDKAEPDDCGLSAAELEVTATLLQPGTLIRAASSSYTIPSILTSMGVVGQTVKPLQSARLVTLCVRMRQLCEEDILGTQAAQCSAARQDFLHGLRSTIVERAAELRILTTKKARQQKHKAVVDLLKELQSAGLSAHASAMDPRQHSTSELFLADAAELDFSSAFASQAPPSTGLHSQWQKDWERTEQLYFRCWLKLSLLRHARPTAHSDLSQREVNKAVGFVEHSFALLLSQRDVIQDALNQCASLQQHLTQLQGLSWCGPGAGGMTMAGQSESEATGTGWTLAPQQQAMGCLHQAHEGLSQLLHVAVETSVLFDQLAAMPQNGSTGRGAAALAIQRLCNRLQAARRLLPEASHHAPRSAARIPTALVTMEHELALKQSNEDVVAQLRELRTIQCSLLESDIRFLAPLLEQLESYAEANAEMPRIEEEAETEADAPSVHSFVDAVEQAVLQLMLAIQGLRKLNVQHTSGAHGASSEGPVPASDEDAASATSKKSCVPRPAEEHIVGEHLFIRQLLEATRCEAVVSRLSDVVRCLHELAAAGSSPAQRAVLLAAQAHAAQIGPALTVHLASFQWVLHQALGYHGAHVRLQLVRTTHPACALAIARTSCPIENDPQVSPPVYRYRSQVLSATFHRLFSDGFCTASQQDDSGAGKDGGGKFDDDVEGTGMGEGSGKQDVSEQMTEEGQLEGDSATKQDEGMDDKGEDGKEERAKEDEGVEMTNEFEGDMKNLEQPDEPQLSDEGEQDDAAEEPEHGMGDLDDENQEVVDERLWNKEDDQDLQPSADEKVERDAAVDPTDDVQMEAKEDDDERPQKKQKREEEQQAGAKEEQPQEAKGDDQEEGEDNAGEEDSEDKPPEDGVRPETEYEDSHHTDLKPQKQEDEEMPEELPADMDTEEAEAGDDGSDDGNDAMSADDDAGGVQEDAVNPPEQPEEDSADNAAQAPTEGEVPDENEVEEAETLPEGARAGQDDNQEPDQEEEEQAPEQDEEETGGVSQAQRKQYEQQQAFDDVQGSNSSIERQADQAADNSQQPDQQPDEAAATSQAMDRNGGEDEAYSHAKNQGSESQKPEGQQPHRSQPQPNPYHALGDALEFWHRKLNLVPDDATEQPDEGERSAPEADDAEPPAESNEFQIAGRNEAADTQVLADATQEQFDEMRETQMEGSEEPREQEAEDAALEEMEGEGAEEPPRPDPATAPNTESAPESKRAGRAGAPREVEEDAEEMEGEPNGTKDDLWNNDGEGQEVGDDSGTHVGALRESGLVDEEMGEEAEDEAEAEEATAKLEAMQAELEDELALWQQQGDGIASAEAIWRRFEARTSGLAQELCEQLRLILEATVASKLQGDYRTGKRISMRKVRPSLRVIPSGTLPSAHSSPPPHSPQLLDAGPAPSPGDPLHCIGIPQGQDLVTPHKAVQAAVSGHALHR